MHVSAGHQDHVDPVTGARLSDADIAHPDARSYRSRISRFAISLGGNDSLAWRFLLVLLAVYVVKQALLVVIFPAFSGHDEVAHFAYVETVVNDQRVPELLEDQLPDYYYRYCHYILDWTYPPCGEDDPRWAAGPPRIFTWGAAGNHPAGEQYVANHPPLYYLVAAPFYWASEAVSLETQQYLLRVLAIPFGAIVVLLAFLTSQTIFPGDRFIAIIVSAFVAFQPQVSYEAAMVNNDIVAITAMSLIIFLMVRGIRRRFPMFDCVLLGLALGTALLIKSNALAVTPIVAIAMIGSIGPRRIRTWIGHGAIVAGLGAIICAPWYIYLWRTYGNFDGLEQVESMQEPWNTPAGTFFGMLTDRDFYWGRWHESWGQFGWRRIPLSDWLLWLIAIPFIIATVGLVLYVIKSIRARRKAAPPGSWWGRELPDRVQVLSILTLMISVVVAYLAIIQFGTRFGLTQARYFFPVVNAIAILLALGLRTVVPFRFRPVVQGLVVSSLVFLNLVLYTKYVVPYWYLTEW